MAKKVNKVIIPFSFEEEGNSLKNLRSNIQNIAKELNGAVGKTLSKNLADSFGQTVKDVNKTFTKANKPVYSKKEAIDLGNALSAGLKKSHQAALQLKETLQKAFDPKMAKEAADSISSLEKKLASLNAAREKWSSLTAASRGSGDASKINRAIKQDTARKNELVTARQNGSITKEEKEELKEINARLKENNALLEEKKRIEAELNELKTETGKATAAALDEEISQTKELITETRNSTLMVEDYEKMEGVINGIIDATEDLTKENEDLGETAGDAYVVMKESAEEAEAHSKKLSQTLREITGFGIGINDLIRGFKQLVREAFEFYKSLDQALTDITIVSNLSRSQVQALTSDFIELSRQTGMAIDDIAQASVIFFQQGLSTKEVMAMTEVTAQFAKVAGSTVEKAADQLTAAINGYKVGVEGAADVADKLNAVAAKSAASIDELATAMSKAASQANQAGLSMDKFYAIIGTIEEVTREAPENIGTSLKTIMARMQQIKEGNNTEDDTDVNAVETALRSVGIRLRDTNSQLKDLEQVLDELGPKWAGLDRNTQAYLGTIIAGTRQQSRFISMMQNWDRVLELTEVSENSAGQQALMHKKAMEGLDAAINTLKNSWQEFLTTLTNSDAFINILKTAAKLLQNISKNSSLGSIITKMTALFILLNKGKIINGFQDMGKSFKNMGPALKQAFTSMTSLVDLEKIRAQATELIEKHDAEIAKLEAQIAASKARTVQLELQLRNLASDASPEAREELNKQLRIEEETRNNLINQINNENKALDENITKITGGTMSNEQYTASMNSLMVAVGTASIALSSLFDVLGMGADTSDVIIGALQAVGGAIVAISMISKIADKTMAVSAPVVYAILGGATLALTGIASLVKGIQGLTDTSGKLKEVNDELKQLTTEYNTTSTEVKGLRDYLKVYDDLTAKIILTKEEQDKLNESIEAMAELGEIEYWTDEQGHNHMKRGDVEKAIESKEDEMKETQGELRKKARSKMELTTGVTLERNDETDKYFNPEEGGVFGVSIYTSFGEDIVYFETKKDAEEFRKRLTSYYQGETDFKPVEKMKDKITYSRSGTGNSSVREGEIGLEHNKGLYGATENFLPKLIEGDTRYNFDKKAYALDQTMDDWADTMNDFYKGTDAKGKEFNEYLQKQILDREKMLDLYKKKGAKAVENYVEGQNDAMTKIYDSEWGQDLIEQGVDFYGKMYEQGTDTPLNEIITNIDDFYKKMEDGLDKNDKDYKDKLKAIKAQQEATKQQFYDAYEFDSEKITQYGLGGYSGSTLRAMDKTGIFNGGEGANQILNELKSGKYTEDLNNAFAVSDENGLRQLYQTLYDITGEMEVIPEDAQKMMTEVEKQLGTVVPTPWSTWADDFEDITKESRKFAEIMKSLRQEGGMTIDQFGDLMTMVDGLADSFMNMGDLEGLQNLTDAINQMDFAIDASTSTIKVNGDATEAMAKMQNALTKAKIDAKIAELHAQEEELTAQRDGLVVYAQLLKQKIEALGGSVDAEEEAAGLKIDNLNRENTALQEDLDEKGDYYKAIAGMIEAVNNEEPPENIEAIKNKGTSLMKSKSVTKTTKSGSGSSALDKYKNELSNVLSEINILDERIASVRKQQELWNKMKKVDWSKWGSGSKSGASKAAKDYVAQLNKIAELLTHIEQEEQKISTLEKLRAMQTGKANIKNLLEEIKLTEHLQEDYVKKYNLERQAALKSKEAIQQAYGKVISFNEDGSYTLNEKKYKKLKDSQKEALDNLIEGYKEANKEAAASYDKIIENIQKEMDDRQKAVDKYIESEDTLVEAIKTREKKILDAKLKAIDKEIEAIDKVAAARRKAREEESDAAEMSGLQVDLQRALMDSSGASASQILSLQKQIKDKQKEMADNSFDTMVDDMKQQLEDEKQMEQDLFDERLEEMDWYWAEVDRIMGEGVQSVLDTMKLYSDEYNQASEVQQAEVLKGWTDTFEQAVVIGKLGAKDMQAAVAQIQEAMNNLNPEDVEAVLNLARAISPSDFGIQDNQTRVDVNRYASGGMNYRTGLAWLDGTRSNPEAVLDAAQTKAFLSFTDDLAALRASGAITNNSNVVIDTISFNVESMSSPEDGEKAFDAFVNRFKQIGAKQGISVNGTANRF